MNLIRYSIAVLLSFAILMASSTAYAQEAKPWLQENLPSLIKLYVHFHKNPELSFEEKETAAKLASELKAIGATVTQNVGGHGVVGILENGDGPTVMLRTDLDGLPVTERTNLAYASTKKVVDADGKTVGVMHACGHDIHMTTLIGAGQFLAANKDKWSGRIMFVGQPAEERGAGAKAMLDDGLFTRFKKPDYALAIHCNSVVPSGKVSLRDGYMMANVDSVDIKIFGRGGHGAYPHTTIDPIVQAAKLILDIQTIVSREIKPIDACVITVGSIHGGTKHNIIADSCHLQLTVRSYSDDVREHLLNAIKRKANAQADSVNAPEPEVTISEGTPSLSNEKELAGRMANVFKNVLGKDFVLEQEPVMGGEDFSHFGRAGVPSLMFFVGVAEQKRLDRYKELGISPPSLHSAEFFPDAELTLTTSIQTMAAAVLDLLKK